MTNYVIMFEGRTDLKLKFFKEFMGKKAGVNVGKRMRRVSWQ